MTDSKATRRQRTQEIAAMFAVAVIPRTFQRSLLPRTSIDQGLITSITVVMVYMLGLLTQDAIEGTARVLAEQGDTDEWSKTSMAIISAAALGAGIISQQLNKYSPSEKLTRSAARTAGKWIEYAGTAGLIMSAIEAAYDNALQKNKSKKERDLLPYFIGAGLLYTLVGEYIRTKKDTDFSLPQAIRSAKPGRVIGITAGVTIFVSGLVYTERFIARRIDNLFVRPSRNLKPDWLPLGHAVGTGLVGAGLYALIRKIYGDIEHSASELETAFTKKPASPYVSGSKQSLVAWDTLSVQGRRHVATALTADQIMAVMRQDALQPIRIFVGLDSADGEAQRAALALAELERTEAYERDYILVVSPTGTGYVNYVMSESLEYQTRGNVASVTIQYSKRPSPMSLDRVDEGHLQYRMLLNGISKRIQGMPPQKRPRILLFGESLGAWTSQDALMHSGTDGLLALHIDRALWIGTPMGSKWKEEVLSGRMLNTEPGLVGLFDSYEEVELLDKQPRQALRYIMVTHHNDPISQFGLQLLVKQPEWVADKTKRPHGMSDYTKYRSPTLFVQTLIDMKNALKPVPGEFVASAHDYRADLARFVAFSYGLKVTKRQLAAIESALRKNEIERERRIKGTL